ncbi:uncharacterized protein LOC128893738 [Hylaeus anthracinus]|uniref:uncharacterized protein LOC128893738 n=1 Tax=Hylaeus anthracinus TaxID=313031 RepID=UPI0023BA13CC|nr:uncharacterized protein LOC128893738 [Hylaeus anthracinus]
MVAEEGNVKTIRGDGLSLKLLSNEQILEITGDGCNVTVAKNYGSVRIIGDGCRLKIDLNLGDVEYRGDGGRVLLGPKSSNKVRYVGDGGRVTVDGNTEKKSKKKLRRPSKKITDEERSKDIEVNKERSSSVEERENAANAKRDAKRVALGNKQEKVTKTVISNSWLQCDEQLVTKWFVNPGTVIRSFDGATFVKIGPKEDLLKKL